MLGREKIKKEGAASEIDPHVLFMRGELTAENGRAPA